MEEERSRQRQEFAASFRRLRGEISQRELATSLIYSKSVISRVETGQQLPSPELCMAYEKVFELRAGTIVGRLNRLERGEWEDDQVLEKSVNAAPKPDGPQSRFRRWRWVTLAAAVVLGVATAGWLLAGRETTTRLDCVEPGALDNELAVRTDAAELKDRLRVLHRLARESDVGCASGLAYRWQALVVQEVALDGVPNGALLLLPAPESDVYLNRAAWGSYHQLAGLSGNMAQTMGGLPGEFRELETGFIEFELSKGALLIAEHPDAPHFWIPAEYVAWWRSHPELGRPTSNPMEAVLSQEFEFGIATVTAVEPQVPKITPVENPGSELPPMDEIRDRILRQADGTSWYVTLDGKRQWLPDGGTWLCAGGEDKALVGDMPSYAIARLPFAGQFRC
jgi:transcriptional regulator with XRE-family HTH domain